jgi:hypothetical protein
LSALLIIAAPETIFCGKAAEERAMIDAVVIQPGSESDEPSVAGMSWASVTAGAVASRALTFVLARRNTDSTHHSDSVVALTQNSKSPTFVGDFY